MAASNNKQVFDVEKPGKSTPSATSRPVITGHGPMLHDPMVSNQEVKPEEQQANPEAKTTSASGEKVIQPMDADTKPEEEPAEETETEVKSDDKEPEAEPAAEEAKSTENQTSEPDKKTANQATVDAVAEQAGKKKKIGPTEEEVARANQIKKMTEEKKYFLPIGEVTRRRNTRRATWVIIVMLILVLIGGYITIDAGLIDSTVSLPFNFIK